MAQIDKVDLQILDLLQENGRISQHDLAKAVGLSAPAVGERLRKLEEREICRLIRDAGWVPAQRDQYYNVLHRHDGPDSPDLRIVERPPVRNVKKVDKNYVGAAPGIDDDADRSVKVQLPILG